MIAIGTGNLNYARSFAEDLDVPFLVLVDDEGEAAKAASVRRASLWELFHPSSFPGTRRAWKDGFRIGKPGKRVNQLGATFVIGPGRNLHYDHYDAHPADHAPLEEIFAVLRKSSER